MNCYRCQAKLIWNSDFDYEDYGLDGEGIVSVLSCTNDKCNTEIEVYTRLNEEEN